MVGNGLLLQVGCCRAEALLGISTLFQTCLRARC